MKYMIVCTYLILMYSSTYADSIDYTKKTVICNYDLTIPLTDGTILYIAVPLLGELVYTITSDYGYNTLGVDFSKDLKKINQDHFYNIKFDDNVDEYKCREAL